jgi:DMSO/TMAO reductase YedYZ molybdopterin-dependent catalytic subunit
MDDDVLVAHSANGQPLTVEHGGPARVIIPKKYAWKGAKFIREITFLDRDILGFWEVRGYSNDADPWLEQRFAQYDSRKLP